MNTTDASTSTRFRVGLFTLLALALIGAITVFVNDRPFWWRACQLVHINVDDATGLKMKSPVRSLGLQIGYLRSVELSETHVRLGICITAPVDVLPSTRAYIRGEGFLGDKFVELKPVRFMGNRTEEASFLNWLIPSVHAAEAQAAPPEKPKGRDIPVGEKSQDVEQLVRQVDALVVEMTQLTTNLKEAINPRELRSTMQQLNKTLENASRTLSPEGGLNTTAQRTLAKLEDAIEQLRDQLTRINKGEGSLGRLLNDPEYAELIRESLINVNRLLSRVGGVRFILDVGAVTMNAFEGGRGWLNLGIWPDPDRYYLLGIAADKRGTRKFTRTTTTAGGVTTVVEQETIDETGLQFTAMFGKVFMRRLDLSVGLKFGEGTLSTALWIGPHDREQMLILRGDVYARSGEDRIDLRTSAALRPFVNRGFLSPVYAIGGLESIRKVNGETPWFAGAGLTFDDSDVKTLFAFL